MQATDRVVGSATELSTRMQFGEDHLDAGQTGSRFDVDGNASAVVGDLDGPVPIEHDLDVLAVSGEGLVDRVVDDLPETVHDTARVGGPDVHTGSFPDGFQPFQHGELVGGVLGLLRRH